MAGPARTQQAPAAAGITFSEDSVRAMSELVEASVRQLRAIYYAPTDARTTALIEASLVKIPARNQRLSRYTASLPREQQQQLAQRLRRQSWQVELNTLRRSPQYQEFDPGPLKPRAESRRPFTRLGLYGYQPADGSRPGPVGRSCR